METGRGLLSGLRVVFVAGTLGQGGAERQLFYMLRALKGAGADPRLLSLTQGEYWESRIASLGVPIQFIGRSPSRLRRLLELIRCGTQERPRLLQSQHFYTNLYVGVAARVLGLKSVGAVRNDVHSELRDTGAAFGPFQLRAPTLLAANSSAAAAVLAGMGIPSRRIELLPNVVDTEVFQPAPTRRGEEAVVFGIGRLVAQKRFDRFLQVLAEVRSHSVAPVKGIVVGDGPLRPELEERARELGLFPAAVQFMGAVADVRPFFNRASVFLLTSDHEGTPNVVLEAMACGLPVVTTRVGDVRELVIDGRTGWACGPDVRELAEAVKRLVTDGDLRREMGAEGRRHIERSFSADSLPKTLQAVYRKAGL